ncbi:MAG: glycyl-radical enzyme activating protein [Clostridiales bacterium]|nr:glycyl-radical enzyme activating protein [Clostridiales bacterium]
MSNELKGVVFNIVHGSFVDGYGIRTTVFLKGCPLRCKWCCNPEGQKFEPELKYTKALCTACMKCVPACPEGALYADEADPDGKIAVDRAKCVNCMKCVEACPYGALEQFGRYYTVDELFDIVRRDMRYYKSSGGGVTLGGGEATAQADFALAFIRKCKENLIHTAVDTCGYTVSEKAFQVLSEADLLLYDLKGMDPERHARNTGKSNELILSNLKRLDAMGIPSIIRLPLIPGYTDSGDEIEKTAQFLSTLRNLDRVDLMNYHEYGKPKYEQIGLDYTLNLTPLTDERLAEITGIFNKYAIKTQIGG